MSADKVPIGADKVLTKKMHGKKTVFTGFFGAVTSFLEIAYPWMQTTLSSLNTGLDTPTIWYIKMIDIKTGKAATNSQG